MVYKQIRAGLTVTILIEFTFLIYVLNCMENGVQVDAKYTDFSKAFYKVEKTG
jgi:hypothetical protein